MKHTGSLLYVYEFLNVKNNNKEVCSWSIMNGTTNYSSEMAMLLCFDLNFSIQFEFTIKV